MRLADLGEFGLIARIERRAARLPASSAVRIGIGDDAAVLRLRAGEDLVVSTDAVVENVHFRWRSASPRWVGRRALVAALSDLAAMGARPLGFTVALAAPPALTVKTADGLVAGLLHEAAAHGCPLVGGNLTAASETSLTLGVMGAVRRGRVLTRRGARVGDRVCVTGVLGRSALEVARATSGAAKMRHVGTPRLAAGRALARVRGVGGCIDVSDGLEADLAHLLEGSGAAAQIDADRLPTPRGFAAACGPLGLDPGALAASGGEDYELLFTLRPSAPGAAALTRRLGVAVSEVGRLVGASRGARRASPGARGHRHF